MHRLTPSRSLPALLLASALFVTACTSETSDDRTLPGEPAETELGVVHFPTSCSAAVQPLLEEGVALVHHMMYAQAEEVFLRAASLEDGCAMAHWGVAMSSFQPFWGSANLEAGRAAAERAVALDPPTEREAAWVRSALAFFEGEGVSYAERVRRWEAAMAELHAAFPEDGEAAAFYALAHLSAGPADPARQERAGAILAGLHRDEPTHPGAVHYAIHVHDVEHRAEAGVPYARAYEEIAPSIPHALHMPSHIYVRLGAWDEVIEWNRASADAALLHPAGDRTSLHYPHALDYLMYGYLQRGREEEALGVLEELGARENYEHHLASAYALAAIPARWYIERREWAGAAALEPRVPASFPWEAYPHAEAMTWFARGLGAARSGDIQAARAAVERLGELEAAAEGIEEGYWARQVAVQGRSIEAWIARAEGRLDDAISGMRDAAELAAGMEKHPITPGDLQPPFELLGDLLLEAGQPEEALEAYERSLATWPARYHTLRGASEAAGEAGRTSVAEGYRAELDALTGA